MFPLLPSRSLLYPIFPRVPPLFPPFPRVPPRDRDCPRVTWGFRGLPAFSPESPAFPRATLVSPKYARCFPIPPFLQKHLQQLITWADFVFDQGEQQIDIILYVLREFEVCVCVHARCVSAHRERACMQNHDSTFRRRWHYWQRPTPELQRN